MIGDYLDMALTLIQQPHLLPWLMGLAMLGMPLALVVLVIDGWIRR